MVQYISKHLKGAWEMISLKLQKMNLPKNHQKDTQSSVYVADMVEEPSEPYVSSVSDVKAAALRWTWSRNPQSQKRSRGSW
jgi:hypothetical protein